MLKKIGELIGPITLLVILTSMLRQVLFYNNYNIPINYFIGISELSVLFARDLLFILYNYFFLAFTLSFFDLRNINPTNKGLKILLTIFFWASLIGASVINYVTDEYYIKIIPLSILVSLAIARIISYFMIVFKMPDFKSFYHFLGFFVLILLPFEICLSVSMEIRKIKNGKTYGSVVKTNDTMYVSNENLLFVGKTENYLFLNNKIDSTNIIIPTGTIKTLVLKEK